MNLLAQLQNRVAVTSQTRFEKEKEEMAAAAERTSDAENSAEMQLLLQLSRNAKKVERVNERDDDLMTWAQKYESLNHDWRRNVVDMFHLLLDEVSEELQDLVANGKAFQFTLEHAQKAEDAHLAAKVREELAYEEAELDKAANISKAA